MKAIKKIMFAIILMLMVCLSLTNIKTKALTAKDQSGVSSFTPNNSKEENIYGMNHILTQGVATTTGKENHNQNINVFSMKTNGISSKLVHHAVQTSNTHYKRTTITAAAKDYEETHPGWIVVGGINADQYYFNTGTSWPAGAWYYQPCPYYPMVSNGEKIFPINILGNWSSVIGLKNDGSSSSFATPTGIGGFVVEIIDENGITQSSFEVEAINKSASEGKTTVWSAYSNLGSSGKMTSVEVNTNKKLFVVENAELAYMYMYEGYEAETPAKFNAFFGRGVITSTDKQSYTVGQAQFAIETSDNNLIAALDKNVRVRVERLFANDEMNNCEEAVGYHSAQRINGVDQTTTAPYDTQQYSRSLFGKKADGTYVLITADMVSVVNPDQTTTKYRGLNQTECSAVAEYYGLTDMYQMDGGGSVTAMVRTESGFKVTNYPKDTGNPLSPRENFSFLFFVVRDPGIKEDTTAKTYHSITLNKIDVTGKGKIENVKVTLDGVTKDFDGDKLTFDNLKDNTEYTFKINYDVVDGDTVIPSEYEMKATTASFVFPTNPIVMQAAYKNKLIFNKPQTSVSSNISNVVVKLGTASYNMGSEEILEITNLLADTKYEVTVSYDIYDETSKQTYSTSYILEGVATLSYEVPTIKEFKESKKTADSISFSYEYNDEDLVVEHAYILVNGNKEEISSMVGSQRIKNLDFSKNVYKFQLVLECKSKEGTTFTVTSDVLTYDEVQKEEPKEEKKKCGKKSAELIVATLASISLLAIVLKKKD